MSKDAVCVTGASGFLGLQVVSELLRKGYTVHATVRDASNEDKVGVLKSLGSECEGKLQLFSADLLVSGSFDDAINGCVCVFHTASPFYTSGKDYTKEKLIRPAVDGTLNVLQSAEKASTVKRVVLTSSTAAIYTVFGELGKEHVFTEEDWSNETKMESEGHWYSLSKTMAEKAAVEFTKNAGFDLSVMNPTLIWGPMLNVSMNTSSAAIAAYLNGQRKEIEPAHKTVVDVRDCAAAHVAAWEAYPQAQGRHLMIGSGVYWKDVCAYIAQEFPQFKDKLPTVVSTEIPPSVLGAPCPHETKFDCQKVIKLLGRPLIGWKDQVKATVESLIKHNLV